MSSKARFGFQRAKIAAVVAGIGFGAGLMAGAGATMPDGRPTPSGLDVPRWVSLKSSQVRARQGPGLDYRILWEYRAAGLPVQVIAETREWRKICDHEGAVAWIHRTVASGRRGALNPSDQPLSLRAGRSETAPVRARLSPRSVTGLEDCEDGWCRLRAGKLRGWVPAGSIFGAQERPLCDSARAAGPAARPRG